MGDQESFADATRDSNFVVNEARGRSDGVDESSKIDCDNTSGDGSSIMPSLGDNIGINDKKSNTHLNSNTRTIEEEQPSGFDPLREPEMITIMDDSSKGTESEGEIDNETNDNEDFGVTFSDDNAMAMMDSNPSGSHHFGVNNDNDCDASLAASQTSSKDGNLPYDGGSFFGHQNDGLRIDNSSPAGEGEAPSWFGAVQDAASKTSTLTSASETTNGDEARQQTRTTFKEGESKEHQESSSATTELMQEISSKLDEKLIDGSRLVAKRLLQSMTVYVQSQEIAAREFERVREFFAREAERLDAVEPDVNGASGMLLGSAGGQFFGTSANPIQTPENRYRRHSSPKEATLPVLPRRDPSLPPTTGNRRRSGIIRDGKEKRGNRSVSFG